MHSMRNINYDRYARPSFSKYLVLLSAISLSVGFSSMLIARETSPECFPVESAWENIEMEIPRLSDNQTTMASPDERAVTLTFNKFESFLPQFYGFAFLRKDIPNIPEITERSAFKEQFRGVKLVALERKNIAGDDSKSYQFTPPTEGTWVIYLVAAINKIPFLEQKNLRISPKVEKVRGGSIFSGSSLHLAAPIDYKACVIAQDR